MFEFRMFVTTNILTWLFSSDFATPSMEKSTLSSMLFQVLSIEYYLTLSIEFYLKGRECRKVKLYITWTILTLMLTELLSFRGYKVQIVTMFLMLSNNALAENRILYSCNNHISVPLLDVTLSWTLDSVLFLIKTV